MNVGMWKHQSGKKESLIGLVYQSVPIKIFLIFISSSFDRLAPLGGAWNFAWERKYLLIAHHRRIGSVHLFGMNSLCIPPSHFVQIWKASMILFWFHAARRRFFSTKMYSLSLLPLHFFSLQHFSSVPNLIITLKWMAHARRHQFDIVCSDSVSKWSFAFKIFILFSRGDVSQFSFTFNRNISSNDCYLKRQTSLFRCQRRTCANRTDDAHILGVNLCGRYDNLETRKKHRKNAQSNKKEKKIEIFWTSYRVQSTCADTIIELR